MAITANIEIPAKQGVLGMLGGFLQEMRFRNRNEVVVWPLLYGDLKTRTKIGPATYWV